MSHIIYESSILEHLFLLEQMAHGSLNTVKFIGETLNTDKEFDYDLSEAELAIYGYSGIVEGYWDNLHTLVSDYLIQCATRTRIMQDFLDLSGYDSDYCPDKEAYSQYPDVAIVLEGNIQLSIRECCNKIIHATSVDLVALTDESTGLKYWSGVCVLSGKKSKNLWKLQLNIAIWVLAMRHYIAVTKH